MSVVGLAKIRVLAALGACLLVPVVLGAFGTVSNWTGNAGTGDWGDAGNWDLGVPDSTIISAGFNASNANNQWSITLQADRTVAGLTFSSTPSITTGFTFNSGNTLKIDKSGISNFDTYNTQTFNNAIALSATQTWTNNGGLVINGTVSLGSNALTVSGAANTITTISGVIDGSGSLTKTNSGTLVLSGANTYTGATNISAGTLQLGATNVLSSSTAVTVGGGPFGGPSAVPTFDLNNFSATVGSIAGTGSITLGSGALTTGANDTSTTFSGIVSGTGSVTKTGAGTFVLSGANTYTGATNINAGVLNIQSNTALGSAIGGTTVASGAALQLQGGITVGSPFTGAEALTLNGTGVADDGALRNISGNNTWTGDVALGSASRINSDADTLTISGKISTQFGSPGNGQNLAVGGAGNMALSGIIGTGTGTLTKDGSGTVTLSGANTYTGATTISTGVLNIQNNTALGTAASGTSVASGAALQTQGGITVTGEALTLNGIGVADDGALRNVSGTNTWTGAVTLGSASRINSDAGTLTLGGAIGGDTQNLTVGGAGNTAISGVIGTTSGSLTKDGAGTLTLSGANTFTGATTISGGILSISTDKNLGTAPGSVTANDLTLNGGTLQTTVNMTLNANRGITLGASSGTLDVNSGTTLTYGGIIAGSGSLTKTDSGTLILSGANTYTGATNINAGVLNIQNATALGTAASGTTVASGAALQVQGGITVTGEALTLNGAGTGSGALQNVSGNNIWDGAIALASDATIFSSTAGNTLNLSTDYLVAHTLTIGNHTLTIDGPGNVWANSNVGVAGDTGGLIKNGTGKLTFYGYNTFYTGATIVNAGSLDLIVGPFTNAPGYYGINGSLTIGTGVNPAGTVSVNIATNSYPNQISPTSAVTINSDGILNVGASTNLGSLTLNGGQVSITSGQAITPSGSITSNTNSAHLTSRISGGQVTLSSPTTVSVARESTLASDMTISSVLAGGGLTKTGAGILTLSGANTYTGATNINAGVLNIQNATALGTSAGGTTVASGAALQTQGGITVTGEALTLNGTGISDDGALRNISGSNTWTGGVTLSSASRINSDAGILTLSGPIGGATQNLTVGGAGNTAISGVIGTTTGSLTKDGAGILTLSGANTYTGATNINAGVLNIQNATALGTSAGGTTVASGAALQTQGGITVTGETLTLNGTGISNDGALRNVSGNNTWTGAVTLGSASRINSDAGTLTLAGAIGGDTQNLTVGGAGNTSISGVIGTTTGSLTKDGAGTLTLSGANTYTGATNINKGTLTVGATNALSSSTDVTVASGATLNLNNYSDTVGSLAGDGVITLGSGTLTVGANNASTTFSGSFTGGNTGTFSKTGTGTLTFGAGMNLSAGTLVLNGGTLSLGNFTSTFGSLSVTADSILDFSASGSSVLNILNSLTVNSGVTLTIQNWADTVDYFYSLTNPGAGNLGRIVFNGFTGADTKWQSYDSQITPVPEPSIYGAALLGLSTLFAGWRLYRRRTS